jgi:hypothetical protein
VKDVRVGEVYSFLGSGVVDRYGYMVKAFTYDAANPVAAGKRTVVPARNLLELQTKSRFSLSAMDCVHAALPDSAQLGGFRMKVACYATLFAMAAALGACAAPQTGNEPDSNEAREPLNGNTPPSLWLSMPTEGATIRGLVSVDGIASDQDDGDTAAVYFSPPSGNAAEVVSTTMYDEPPLIYIFVWDSTKAPNGPAVLTVFAEDDNGGSTTIRRNVIIAN